MRGIAGIGDKVWNDSLAMTVGAIGTTGFAPALIEALTHVAPFNYSVIFAYCNSARPLDLFDRQLCAAQHHHAHLLTPRVNSRPVYERVR